MLRFPRALALFILVPLCACGGGDEPSNGDPPPTSVKALTPEQAAHVVALQNRGVALLERYDYGQAVPPLEEAYALAPEWNPARLHLALALLHSVQSGTPRAQQLLEDILADDPAHPHALFMSGYLAENSGETERALERYEKAYEATRKDAVVGAKLGTLLMGLDREDEALPILLAAHERNPALISPVYSLMLLYRRLGDDVSSKRFLDLMQALKGSVREDMEAKKGQDIGQAYGNFGPYSMGIRDFGAPLEGGARPDPAVAAGPPVTIGDKLGTAAAVLDYDGDGDLDLFVSGPGLLRNDGDLRFTPVSEAAGISVTNVGAVAAGELDAAPDAKQGQPDGYRPLPDLVLVTWDKVHVLLNQGDGTFRDATEASGLAGDPGGATAVLLFDADHEGDLDVFLSAANGQKNRLWANSGAATFREVAGDAGLAGDGREAYGPATVIDVDGDYDLDLVVARPQRPAALFLNGRGMSFVEEAAAPDGVSSMHGLISGDFDRDGREDVVLCGEASATLLRGDGTRFVPQVIPGAPGGPVVDVDPRLSGLRDLVFAHGVRLPATESDALFGAPQPLWDDASMNVLAADLDGDGAEDVVRLTTDAPARAHRLEAPGRGNAVVLEFRGVVRDGVQAGWSNLEGRGALVEVKAGSTWQMHRVGNPGGHGVGSANRLVVGVGDAEGADFVRVLWPDGVQQATLDVPAQGGVPNLIVEEQRRPDSCPLLFAWDGERFAFVTDFIGAGGLGFLIAPGVYADPDPTENVKVESRFVKPDDDGRLVFKLVEAMEEMVYIDRCDLLVVDHPSDVTVFPDERFAGEPPYSDGKLLAYAQEIVPVAARDGRGQDVLDRVLHSDRRYPDGFRLHPRLLGATETQILELDFGERLAGVAAGDELVLYADSWIEYGYTRTSMAAAGEGFEYLMPTLEAWKPAGDDAANGSWVQVAANIGYPAGFPRVMTYDVTGLVSRDTPRLRIRTNFEVYWDRVWLAPKASLATARRTVLQVESAELAWVGYPREYSPDGRIPRIYDYHTTDPSMPWKTVEGDYTRYGDVRPLLGAADDMYVIYGKGEEIDVRFDARALPDVEKGWTRSYVLRFVGWCKGQELYTAHGFTVGPLPFLGMSTYPYPATETYPDDEAHRRYRREYNTRRVGRRVRGTRR